MEDGMAMTKEQLMMAAIESGRQEYREPEAWEAAQAAIKAETREMRATMEHINDLIESGVIDLGGFKFKITPDPEVVISQIERMGEAMARKWEEEG